MSTKRAIGLDVGGTKIAGGVVDADGTLSTEIVEPTPEDSDAEAVSAVLLDIVGRLREKHPDVSAIGVGAAGIVQWPEGRMLWAPNNAYRDWPVREQLEAATGLPAVIDNDANVAVLAEARLGPRPYRELVLVTVGTGIGGGLVLDGRIYRGPTGRGAELGHIVLNPDGPVCGCGNHGCFEAYASGTALTRMGREAADDDPRGLIARLGAEQGEVTGRTVTAAATQGDAVARDLFGRLGRWLGVGIASLANIFELEAVVVGGGLVSTGDLLLEPARRAAREFAYATQVREPVPIRPAVFGGDAGMIGAALLALEDARPSVG
ncbi:ROK family protein [Pseudonocardia hydrocarbonoxydans]|uniref:Glucokinase n=1 Tax=Pseudonocardia hydrocarbonoxydans TaxID=76726 RepID=A0A4Y3WNR6_9PSEU|nr:ROK family protein [Pseudonocardia hydrocarbonoxydans]GEC19881.1 glucokinase [Pseudonocardia hydrocarbonoxydans]